MSLSNRNNVNYDLLAKYFAGETTHAEAAAVDSWVAQSAENQAQFAELKFIWRDSFALKNIGNEALPDVDVTSALNKVKSSGKNKVEKPQLKVVKSPNKNYFLRIAASIVLLLGVGWYIFNLSDSTAPPVEVFAENTILDRALPDGSAVKLNQGATLTYPEEFTTKTREVRLEGEAFFDVRHDPQKPFIIRAGEANIRVLGTSFNVKSSINTDSTLVYVESGKVLLYFEKSEVTLTKGMTGVFYKKSQSITVLEAASPDHSFWRNKNLYFKKTRLGEVVNKLNTLYNVNIRLQNQKLANCHLTVDFENKTIDEILDIISLTLDLETVRNGTDVVLEGEGC